MKSPLLRSPSPERTYRSGQVPPEALWMVILTVFCDIFAASVLEPVLPSYAKQSFNASDAQVGLLFALPNITAFLFSFVLAEMTRRWGRKPVFLICLLGMGTAALIQALATSCDMLLFGRAFGGAWTAVVTTAKVYINEVTSWDTTGTECSYWQSQMTAAQSVAKLFAPGIGGALTHYGMSAPSVITAAVEAFGCCLVGAYVVESPQFLIDKQNRVKAGQRVGDKPAPAAERTAGHCRSVLLVGLANMFTSSGGKIVQSTYALYAIRLFAVDSVDIGFIFLAGALVTVVTSRLVLPLTSRLGPYDSAVFLAIVTSSAFLLMALGPCLALLCQLSVQFECSRALSICAFCLASAANSAVSTFVTILSRDLDDQPTVQAQAFRFRQAGNALAALVATRLLDLDSSYPWLLAALVTGAAAVPCYCLKQMKRKEEPAIGFGEDWADDDLSEHDTLELGRFVGSLLRKRHLRWSSQRDKVELILDAVIPEMPTDKDRFHDALAHYTQNPFMDV